MVATVLTRKVQTETTQGFPKRHNEKFCPWGCGKCCVINHEARKQLLNPKKYIIEKSYLSVTSNPVYTYLKLLYFLDNITAGSDESNLRRHTLTT